MMSLPFLTALTAKATVLAAAALLCLFFSRRSPAGTRHLICSGFFGALLSLPLLMAVMPAWLPENAVPLWLHVVANGSGKAVQPASLLNWQTMTLAIWIAGAAFILTRLGVGFVLLRRALRQATPVTGQDWQSDLEDASDSLGLKPDVIQLSFGTLNTPVTFGFRQPVILLPREAAQWGALTRKTVLLHELAHIQRRDWLWNCAAQIALAAFWFHPLVWVLYDRLRREEEFASDEATVRCGIQPTAYAEVLLEMTRSIPSRFLLASGISGKGNASFLRARFAHILQQPQNQTAYSRKTSIGFLVLVLAACAAFHTGFTPKIKASEPEKVYKIGGDVSAPKLLHKVQPDYPPDAKQDKIEGTTLLQVVIGTDGKATDILVTHSLRADFDQKAVTAVEQWLFQPGVRNGLAVAVKANIEINFKLQ